MRLEFTSSFCSLGLIPYLIELKQMCYVFSINAFCGDSKCGILVML